MNIPNQVDRLPRYWSNCLAGADNYIQGVIVHLLLTILTIAGYVLLVSGLSLVFGDILKPSSPIIIGLMVLLLAWLWNHYGNSCAE